MLTAKLDTAWAELVKTNKPYCERCGKSGLKLDAGHIVGRQNRRLRWDTRNSVVLCFHDHRWWHDHPLESAAWIRAYRPEDVAYLEVAKNEITHYTAAEKKAKLAELQSSLALGQAA